VTYHLLHPLGGRFTLAQYLAAFFDGEELRPDEKAELLTTAETIIAHAAHGWPENGPRTLEDTYVHFRPEDFTQ
jgi:hypothetical protein